MIVEPAYWDKPSYRIMAKQLDDLLGKEKQLQAIADAYRLFIVVSDHGEAHTPEARLAFEKVLTTLDTLIDRDALTEGDSDEPH